MPSVRRTVRHRSAALLLAAPLLGTAAPATAAEPGPVTSDPAEPCLFTWWNGRQTGLIDLANPAARQWYSDDLHARTRELRVAGFKFDTAFFDNRCAPCPGPTRADHVLTHTGAEQ